MGKPFRREYMSKDTPAAPSFVRKEKKVLMTTEEQRQIDESVARMHKMELESRVLRPGHPDFDAIASLYQKPAVIPTWQPRA